MTEPARDKTLFIVYGANPATDGELISQCREALPRGREVVEPMVLQRRIRTAHSPVWGFDCEIAYFAGGLLQQLMHVARQAAKDYCRILERRRLVITQLAGLLEAGVERGSWDGAMHVVIAGMIIDMGVLRELTHRKVIVEQPDHCWVWAFQGGTGAINRGGVKLWKESEKTGFLAQVWHHDCARVHPLKILEEDVALLGRIAAGERLAASSLSETGLRQTLKLSFYRLLARVDGCFVLNPPVLQGDQGVAFMVEIRSIAAELFENAIGFAVDRARELFRSEIGDDAGILRHGFARMLLEHGTDQLMEAQLLPPFPKSVPSCWGTWLNLVDNA